jgi:putative flavoprotein involved in K+ transport
MERHEKIIIGGGQAGLAMSYQLRQRGREHLLLERDRLGGRWHTERWNSLHYQFPNWSLRLPGYPYSGSDPEGFCHYSSVVDYLADYARQVDPPARLGVEVERLRHQEGRFILDTGDGPIAADHVIVATGAFPHRRIPAFANNLSPSIMQLHSSAYKCPAQLLPGAVLVVGSGSSGGQIAEELHHAGRQVFLSVSRHRRVPRRFLGKDMLWWFFELGWMDRTIDSLPGRKPPPAILVSGIDGGHDMNVRMFAAEGMTLLGRAVDAAEYEIFADDNLGELLDGADAAFDEFTQAAANHARQLGMTVDSPKPEMRPQPQSAATRLDLRASGITSIIWCTGYRPAFDWIKIPVFDTDGAPVQERGRTACPGLYFLGLHWMHSFKSGALFGVGEDADHIAEQIDR